jgi:glyceraldehyde 3-phosphate dehydrogenase
VRWSLRRRLGGFLIDNLAYLLKYDTVYGRYHRAVAVADGALLVDDRRIAAFAERDPANLPWADRGVDLVVECTGVFKSEDDLKKHIQAGASFVILSAPTTSETVPPWYTASTIPTVHHRSSPAPAAPPTASPRSSRSPTATSGFSGL